MLYSTQGSVIAGEPVMQNDNTPITLGNTFYVQSGKQINVDNAFVTGGRAWTNGIGSPGWTISIKLYEIPPGDVNPIAGRTPVRDIIVPINSSGWTEGIFAEPWKIPDYNWPWVIAYRVVDIMTLYYTNANFRSTDVPYSQNASGLVLSQFSGSNSSLTWHHGYYDYTNVLVGSAGTFSTGYGTDSIVETVAPASPWSVWDGSQEVPASAMMMWNGTAEVPVTVSVN